MATIYKSLQKHKVSFQWIKGHNNHPQNERCDSMAGMAAKKKNLVRDIVLKLITRCLNFDADKSFKKIKMAIDFINFTK